MSRKEASSSHRPYLPPFSLARCVKNQLASTAFWVRNYVQLVETTVAAFYNEIRQIHINQPAALPICWNVAICPDARRFTPAVLRTAAFFYEMVAHRYGTLLWITIVSR